MGGVLQEHVDTDGVEHGRWCHGDDGYFDILARGGDDELDNDDQKRHGQDVVRAIEPPASAVDGSELWISFEEYPIPTGEPRWRNVGKWSRPGEDRLKTYHL